MPDQMMENHRIDRIEHQPGSMTWRNLLQYLDYAEQRTRRGAILLQLVAVLFWLAAVLTAPASSTYKNTVLLSYVVWLFSAIGMTAASGHISLRMAGRVVFLLMLTKGLGYLIGPSPNHLMWALTLCAVILVAMSPLYNEPLSFLFCAASVCHELVWHHLAELYLTPEAGWMGVLIVSSLSLGVMLNFFYFSERTRAYLSNSMLLEMAYIDSLTRIHNRRAFLDDLARACRHSQANDGFYFLLIDVDNFKAVNDFHGHARGDLVLQQVAGQIRRLAGEHGCGRLGGEEFGIIFHGDEAQALAFASAINSSIAANDIGGLRVTVSIGLARHRYRSTLESVMLQADKALYAAKAAGKNCAVLAPLQESLQ